MRESEWMSLSEFKSELSVFFLRDLEVIVSKFRNNFCKSLWENWLMWLIKNYVLIELFVW